MRITVGLTSADRPDYTRRTVESFVRHNDLDRFELLHFDDGSETGENCDIARAHGFATYRSPERVGHIEALRELLRATTCDLFLSLENDWEWAKPFPWELVGAGWECLRLYGPRKERESARRVSGPHVMGTFCEIAWQPMLVQSKPTTADIHHVESAIAHWAGPPSVCRTDELRRYVADADTFKQISLRFRPWTWRPIENVVWHIGDIHTPRFKH